ncbi:Protein of unknown function [Bacillus wiedmannii]|nr:Protein of unknown function [Bacillus wiedmannii]
MEVTVERLMSMDLIQ